MTLEEIMWGSSAAAIAAAASPPVLQLLASSLFSIENAIRVESGGSS